MTAGDFARIPLLYSCCGGERTRISSLCVSTGRSSPEAAASSGMMGRRTISIHLSSHSVANFSHDDSYFSAAHYFRRCSAADGFVLLLLCRCRCCCWRPPAACSHAPRTPPRRTARQYRAHYLLHLFPSPYDLQKLARPTLHVRHIGVRNTRIARPSASSPSLCTLVNVEVPHTPLLCPRAPGAAAGWAAAGQPGPGP